MLQVALWFETAQFCEKAAHFSQLTAFVSTYFKSSDSQVDITRINSQETCLRSILLDPYRYDHCLLFSP